MLFGAAIASIIKNPILAVILAFLSHYLLDFIPHNEYNVEDIKSKHWKKSLPDFLKICLDLLSGILLIFLSLNLTALPADRQAIIFVSAFFSILPDSFSFLNYLINSKILKTVSNFHQRKVHFLRKNKKNPSFWRIASQILIIAFSIFLISGAGFFALLF